MLKTLKAALRFYRLRSGWLGDGGQPVPQALANQRTATCCQCRLNNRERPVWQWLAEHASAELRQQVELKAQMKLVARDEDLLGVCDGCDCLLSLKVWVPLDRVIATTPLEKLASGCWITQEKAKLP